MANQINSWINDTSGDCRSRFVSSVYDYFSKFKKVEGWKSLDRLSALLFFILQFIGHSDCFIYVLQRELFLHLYYCTPKKLTMLKLNALLPIKSGSQKENQFVNSE